MDVSPGRITYASPFLWRPDDVVDLSVEPFGSGCRIDIRQTTDGSLDPLEAAALRHRWGEHLDRDLRNRFDSSGRADPYEVSLYRGDVDDWTIVDRVLGRSWIAIQQLPVRCRLPRSVSHLARTFEQHLQGGDVIWAGEMGRHRTSVVCIAEKYSGLDPEDVDASEIFVPLPAFGRRLHLA